MSSKIIATIVALAACSVASAQWIHNVSASPLAAIPSSGTGGAAGGCANPANTAVVAMPCSEFVRASNVKVSLLMYHSWARDLRITVTHGGVSVTVFSQMQGTEGHTFNGLYQFADNAASGFQAAIIPGQNLLQVGTYQPALPLSAFNGMSGAGPWTIEVCDLQNADSGTLVQCGVSFESGTFYNQMFPVAEPLPDGAGSLCASPLTHVVIVPWGNGPVCRLQVGCEMSHQRAGDLTITLSHGPKSVTLCSAVQQIITPQLGGQYLFDDDAPTSWAQEMAGSNFSSVPIGSYRPQSALSAFDGVESGGPWFLTVCDGSGNGLQGSLGGIYFGVDVSGYRFDLSQPSGSSSIVLKNSGGVPGDLYVNAFTFVPGSFPFGWLNGLDIAMTDLVNQINMGVPFVGVLDPNGGATTTIPGPIPFLTLQCVSFDVTPAGIPVTSIPAKSFTTAP